MYETISGQDKYGRTTLSYVAERGNETMVDVLITKCDADPTIEDVKEILAGVSQGHLAPTRFLGELPVAVLWYMLFSTRGLSRADRGLGIRAGFTQFQGLSTLASSLRVCHRAGSLIRSVLGELIREKKGEDQLPRLLGNEVTPCQRARRSPTKQSVRCLRYQHSSYLLHGNTPLMYAVSAGSVDIVAHIVGYFLVVNFPIDKRNFVGNTALILAAKMGRYDCATMLVEVGSASMTLRDANTFRSSLDWIRITCPDMVDEFRALDPVLKRKRECSIRRRHPIDRPRYRILMDFFPDGKMPSCWRSSSSKSSSQEPRKHQINRTICIVSGMDEDPPPPAPPPTIIEPPPVHELEMEETLDSILSSLQDHHHSSPTTSTPQVTSSSSTCVVSSGGDSYSGSVPKSMFDIPTLMDVRSEGRFLDTRCDSVMSCVSAPSPTFARLFEEVDHSGEFVTNTPPSTSSYPSSSPPTKPMVKLRNEQRRRSIDNSSLLSRPQVSSPVVKARPNSRTRAASNPSSRPVRASPSTDKTRRTSDPLARASPAALTRVPVAPEKKIRAGRAGLHCSKDQRKSSLPSITKPYRPDSFVHT
eukprot:sb/3463295/